MSSDNANQQEEFDSSEDDFFVQVAMPPSPKRARIDEEPEDSFPDDDDEVMCQFADSVENSFAAENSEDETNKFVTGIGRPHPLLLPEVLKEIFSYALPGSTLKSARAVCAAWYDAANNKSSESNRFKNAVHLTELFPYGLGYDDRNKTFSTPFPPLDIVNLRIADPCAKFMKPQVSGFLSANGHKIKHFSFDANFWCQDHIRFLAKVLFTWCRNLEELELVGLSNREALETRSLVSSFMFSEDKPIVLKKLVVNSRRGALNRSHHHYSTTSTIPVQGIFLLIQMGLHDMDGGLLGKIIRNSYETLQELRMSTEFRGPCRFIWMLRQFRVPLDRIKILEVTGSVLTTRDVTYLMNARLRLSVLVIGPLSPRLDTTVLEQLLTSLSGTLEEFNVNGNLVERLERDNVAVLGIYIPALPSLRVLKISNIFRLRIGAIDLIARLPGLRVLELSNGVLQHSNQDFYTAAIAYLQFLFSSADLPATYSHGLVESLVLAGNYAYGSAFSLLWVGWFPNLKSLSVVLELEQDLCDSLVCISNLRSLENLDVQFSGSSNVTCFSDGRVWATLRQFTSLKSFQVTLRGVAFSTLLRFQSSDASLYNLTVRNFKMYDEEAKETATCLADSINFTRFSKCRVVPKKRLRRGGVVCSSTTDLDGVVLTKLNLGMLVKSHFHEL